MLHLLVALLLVSGAWAQCNCSYLTQPPPEHDANNWPTFYIQNPTTPDYTPCIGSCKYFLNSSDPNKGIGNYHIFKWDDDGGKNSLSVYDCDANGVESNILLFNATYNNPTDKSFQSTGQYVCVELSVVKPVTIIVGMSRTSLGTTAAPRKTTKPPVPTTPYNGSYTKDPSLVSLDVMFMVDGGSKEGSNSTAFDQSKILAAAIVNAFDPNTVFAQNASVAPAWGSRMALRFLTSVNSQYIGTPWNQNSTFISNQIGNLFQVNTPTSYKNCLVDLLNSTQSAFSVSSSAPEQSSRPTAERMLIIVASSVPTDLDDIRNLTNMFTALDVHPVFIAYGMQNNEVSQIKAKLAPFWGVTSVPTIDNLDDSVTSFFDDYLLDATNVCNVNTTIEMPSYTEHNFTHPSNYRSAKDSWDEDHQTGRYCNFQHLSYRFQVGADVVQQFTVTYELEPGKDILNFYQDDGTEIVSLSGADVGPSTFSTMGPVTAEFTSNESQVFGGFNITYKIITSSGPTNV